MISARAPEGTSAKTMVAAHAEGADEMEPVVLQKRDRIGAYGEVAAHHVAVQRVFIVIQGSRLVGV